jgi:hypothetical protein
MLVTAFTASVVSVTSPALTPPGGAAMLILSVKPLATFEFNAAVIFLLVPFVEKLYVVKALVASAGSKPAVQVVTLRAAGSPLTASSLIAETE